MKKKAISLALTLTMLLSLCLPASARSTTDTPSAADVTAALSRISARTAPEYVDDFEDEVVQTDDFIFALLDGSAFVVMCNPEATGKVTIPATVKGCPVLAIAAEAFFECEGITEIVIPQSVVVIDDEAFMYCSSLTKAKLPSGLDYLGCDVFFGTPIMDKGMKNGLFYVDGWLAYVDEDYKGNLEIPFGTKGIACGAAANCWELSSVTFPETLKCLAPYAFMECPSLHKVVFTASAPFIEDLTDDIFSYDTLTAYYPADDTSWNSQTLLSYGGTITWTPARFVDLLGGNWYDPYCEQAADMALMGGVGANHFDPNSTTTRAMLVQILYSLSGKPEPTISNPFTDVPDNAWFTKAILWAYENGITGGISPTEFAPDIPVTREQVALLLYAFCGRPEITGDLSKYADTNSVHSWAADGMIWATQHGIMSGSLDAGRLYLMPTNGATRAQTATMMVAFVNKLLETV